MERVVSVIGGGPAGLFAARLLARQHPDWRVTVYERADPSATFGFGVGLTGGLLSAVAEVDPETAEVMLRGSARVPVADFRLPSGCIRIPGFHHGVAVSRSELLGALVEQARAAGVRVELGRDAALADAAWGADLVIAADGVSSSVREARRDVFEPTASLGRGIYLWCGSEAELEGTVFEPAYTEHGVFTVHAYPYGPHRSTLVVETDEAALRSLEASVGAAPAGAKDSDERSLAFLSEAFRTLLSGAPLIGNRSQWFRFSTVRCARWTHGNVVLLGDAAANADPSLGSGTKLAMESAIALADALADETRSIADALRAFEDARRPAVDRFQRWAGRSQRWWDSFPRRLGVLSGERIAAAFLSRLKPFPLDDAGPARDLVRAAAASWSDLAPVDVPSTGLTDWILSRPLAAPGVSLPQRNLSEVDVPDGAVRLTVDVDDPWGDTADATIVQVLAAKSDGASAVVLDGATAPGAVEDRLDVAERIRLETGLVVAVVAGPQDTDAIACGLIAGRIDFAVARAAMDAAGREIPHAG